ncbi:MAG TPA: HAD-IA family hydrolase [Mycobacterium sp.]|nr:HAD-IA family hydrolase [Mycobacterium sp.]
MSAIFFGSISTLADTSELQRRAFNEAFSAHGLDWNWSRDDYRSMLASNGGADRVRDYAKSVGAEVDAAAVHSTKSEIFQELVAKGVAPRPGVVDTVESAKAKGVKLGLVTTTSKANVDALLSALQPHIGDNAFDVVVDKDSVDRPKPDGACYEFALERLGVEALKTVAIEDNEGGVKAAAAAGVPCIAFPNENTAGGDFSGAAETVERLDQRQVISFAATERTVR